jgi:hypothetical protein
MADPSFVDLEVEAESASGPLLFSSSGERDDKLHDLAHEEEPPTEHAPLLGPHALASEPDKRWHNTASVKSIWSYFLMVGVLVVADISFDGIEFWGHDGAED